MLSAEDFSAPQAAGTETDTETMPCQRPQSIVLTFGAAHLMPRRAAVQTADLVQVLECAGVSTHAARSTLARMVRRGLLERHRLGRRVYLGLTEYGERVLREGTRRMDALGAVNRTWDGHWTLLGFSLPESRRPERHLLRSRLSWAGFGLLQNGLWISASPVSVNDLLDGLDVVEHVKAFRASALSPTDIDAIIDDAWDLPRVAANYHRFLRRWEETEVRPASPGELARQLLMQTEWLLLIRNDPYLPVQHLPSDWPAVRAENAAMRLRAGFQVPADQIVDERLDLLFLGERPSSAEPRPVCGRAC